MLTLLLALLIGGAGAWRAMDAAAASTKLEAPEAPKKKKESSRKIIMWQGEPWHCQKNCSHWYGCCGDDHAFGVTRRDACHHCACLAQNEENPRRKRALTPSCQMWKACYYVGFNDRCPRLAEKAGPDTRTLDNVAEASKPAVADVGKQLASAGLEDNGPASAAAITGSCSLDDYSKLNAAGFGNGAGSFGEKCSKCGTSNFRIMAFAIDAPGFSSCLASGLGVSDKCSSCYAAAAQYGVEQCMWQCKQSWCSEECLTCSQANAKTLSDCTGFPVAPTRFCDGESGSVQCEWTEWSDWAACPGGSACLWKRFRSTLGKKSPSDCPEPPTVDDPELPRCSADVGAKAYCVESEKPTDQSIVMSPRARETLVSGAEEEEEEGEAELQDVVRENTNADETGQNPFTFTKETVFVVLALVFFSFALGFVSGYSVRARMSTAVAS